MSSSTVSVPPLVATGWHVYRIVPSIFPPVSIFDRIAKPADLELVFQLESMTNDRLREEAGDISLVPPEDRVVGPGSTPVMAAFTHLNPDGGRFTDSTFSAYYAAREIETAVAETKHHREEFLRQTDQEPIDIDMRVYLARLEGDLHDVRGDNAPEGLYAPDDYSAGQSLGRRLRDAGANGIVYDSVRAPGGTCVAVFRPRCLSNCLQERHLTYRWDGATITHVYEKREFVGAGANPVSP